MSIISIACEAVSSSLVGHALGRTAAWMLCASRNRGLRVPQRAFDPHRRPAGIL
jgi:hypothetical protein